MKKSFIIALLVVSVGCYGQDTARLYASPPTWAVDYPIITGTTDSMDIPLDTVLCVMILSDTGRRFRIDNYIQFDSTKNSKLGLGFKNISDTSYYEPYEGVVQYFGYEVREVHNEIENSVDWYFDHRREPQDYFIHLKYLDKNKKPIHE